MPKRKRSTGSPQVGDVPNVSGGIPRREGFGSRTVRRMRWWSARRNHEVLAPYRGAAVVGVNVRLRSWRSSIALTVGQLYGLVRTGRAWRTSNVTGGPSVVVVPGTFCGALPLMVNVAPQVTVR